MKFKTKAQNLVALSRTNINIPKIFKFNVKDYELNKFKILKKIKNSFLNNIALRSSCFYEDNLKSSMAGAFESYLNINPNDETSIIKNINNIIRSYKKYKNDKNEIFAQQMVKNIKYSGVATTCDLHNYSPYYTINIIENKDSTLVTSGVKNSKKIYCYKNYKPKNKNVKKIITLLKYLTKKFKNKYIEIEFIIDKKNTLYLIQVRPIKISNEKIIDSKSYSKILNKLEKKIIKLKKKNPHLYGKTTAFGVMPDWNPAEIIGIKPKPLALSIYKELITDHIWAENRKTMDFKDISSHQLMTTFFGTPFIDIRVDFNSWLPNNLDDKLSEKLINFYIQKYISNTSLHDKVEFEILLSCYTPSTEKKLKNLKLKGFSNAEVKKISLGLKNINKKTISSLNENIKKINLLKKRQLLIEKSSMYYVDKIYSLVQDCKQLGTFPFAGLARCGFVATELLNSLIEKKIISEKDKQNFLSSNVSTITSKIIKDFNSKSKAEFISIYGHLRPDTYEITSKNYGENYKEYFGKRKKIPYSKKNKFIFTDDKKKLIIKFLKKSNLNISFDDFIIFIKQGIEQREYSKFVFSKSIDLIFKNLKKLTNKLKIKFEDISYLNIKDILNLYYNLEKDDLSKIFNNQIKSNKRNYEFNVNFKFPDNICKEKDLYFFEESENKINFFGNDKIIGKITTFKKNKITDIRDRIVCIDNADPGYDFIFNRGIKGLVTQYGGANSHMSIRCAELSIPAAIGVGEKKYNEIIDSKSIEIDSLNKNIKIIQ